MKKYVKPILLALLAIFLLAQFIRPGKNLSNESARDIATKYPVPDSVQAILKVACNDCHTNYTVYPWYAEVQPVAAWLANHVDEGKRKLNLSTFTTRPVAVQNHKFEEIIEMVQEDKMPLPSYTWVHRDAILTEAQKQTLIHWAQAQMDSLKAQYPADSLVLKRRG